jgi:hypothetical protein
MISTRRHLLLGGCSIAFGLVGLAPIILKGMDRFVMSQHEAFGVKYFIIITFLNGSFFFVTLGILLILGYGLSDTASSNFEYIKAKNTLLSILLTIPFWLSLNSVIFELAADKIWYLFVVLMDIYLLYILLKNISRVFTTKDGSFE